MKRIILFLVVLFFLGCTDDVDKSGQEGESCKADKSCDSGLICNSSNICEKESIDDKGKEGKECRDDKSCDTGLVCNISSNICEKESTDDRGKEGKECRDDKSCDTGLVCNTSNNICEKESTDDRGKEGKECRDDKSCDDGLVCNSSNICEKESIDEKGTEGNECRADKSCDQYLFCNVDNICEKEDVIDFGKEGKPCIKVGDKKCFEGLFCNEYDICEALVGDRGDEGNPCREDLTCNNGLMCALEDECMNVDDFNTAGEGQDCRDYDFCYDGFYCDTFGTCVLDCSVGNDSLCDNGEFDYSSFPGTYKILSIVETRDCGSNDYTPKNIDYTYFRLILENDYGYKRLSYHTCENSGNCSSSGMSYYKVTPDPIEYATADGDDCIYTSLTPHVRKIGNKIRLRYTFDEARVVNDSECASANVHLHYGEMECTKIRLIYGTSF